MFHLHPVVIIGPKLNNINFLKIKNRLLTIFSKIMIKYYCLKTKTQAQAIIKIIYNLIICTIKVQSFLNIIWKIINTLEVLHLQKILKIKSIYQIL
jgi:hypothetical protein